MEVTVLKTAGIISQDWDDIAAGFNQSFDTNKTVDDFKKYYSSNIFGTSYHAVVRNNHGRICGHTSIVPWLYTVNGKEYKFGLSGGTFVAKEYRTDVFILNDLYTALRKYCAADNIAAIVGVPNKNSFKYFLKILGFTHLKDLNYFIMPVAISKILGKKYLKAFDIAFKIPLLFFLMFARLVSYLFNPEEAEWSVEPIMTEEALKLRFNDKYQKFKSGSSEGTYRIFNEKGINTAYIMDFKANGRRTFKALTSIVIHIFLKEKADAILFIGDMRLKQFLLFQIPGKKIPQRFPLVYDLLKQDDAELRNILASPTNWDFSLLNFDVR